MNASVHALSGAYALDALDEFERRDFERHLAVCDDCQAEVAGLREAASLLTTEVEAGPPARLRARVLADIAAVRPLPPLAGSTAEREMAAEDAAAAAAESATAATPVATTTGGATVLPFRRRVRPASLAAAAAVLAILGAGTAAVLPLTGDEPTNQLALSPTERILQAEDREEVVVELDGGVKATLVRSVSVGRALVITENMPPPPDGKVYELWFDDAKRGFVAAGVMPIATDQVVLLQGDALNADGVGITVEPEGGSTMPTTEPIVMFDLDPVKA